MEFSFTEQQIELRQAVRRLLENECPPEAVREAFSTLEPHTTQRTTNGRHGKRWRLLSELGATGLLVPEACDGLGLTELDLVGVLEEAGRAALPEPLTESAGMAAGTLVDALSLTQVGSEGDALLRQLLSGVASGELLATVGGVVPARSGVWGTTSIFEKLAARGTMHQASNLYQTPNVAAAATCDLFVLASPLDAGSADHRVDQTPPPWVSQVYAVMADDAQVSPVATLDPTRALATITWDTEEATLLAEGEDANALVISLTDRASLLTTAQLLGLTETMIQMAANYAGQRHQFGRPIGSFQAVKHLLANARVKLEFARPALYRAACSLSQRKNGVAGRGAAGRGSSRGSAGRGTAGRGSSRGAGRGAGRGPGRGSGRRPLADPRWIARDVSMAKAMANDAAELAAAAALQVHGAIGYTAECDLHLWLKRTWALLPAWGDARTHRARVLDTVVQEVERQRSDFADFENERTAMTE